jgi:hypothetical protein
MESQFGGKGEVFRGGHLHSAARCGHNQGGWFQSKASRVSFESFNPKESQPAETTQLFLEQALRGSLELLQLQQQF